MFNQLFLPALTYATAYTPFFYYISPNPENIPGLTGLSESSTIECPSPVKLPVQKAPEAQCLGLSAEQHSIGTRPIKIKAPQKRNSKNPKPSGTSAERRNLIRRKTQKSVTGLVAQTINFLSRPIKSRGLCSRVFRHYQDSKKQEWTTQRFYTLMKLIKSTLPRHQDAEILVAFSRARDNLRDLFTLEEQGFYLKVARVLIKLFLNEGVHLSILLSQRIQDSEARLEHLRKRRNLLDQYLEGLKKAY